MFVYLFFKIIIKEQLKTIKRCSLKTPHFRFSQKKKKIYSL